MQSDSPYKFLDYYEFSKENPEPFFGRQRETQILFSDILVSRLVVLFAQTGTGKTSLINAGVRPLLEKRDYKHFVVRSRNDPAESARAELCGYLKVTSLKGETLADQFRWARKRLKSPLVLFFDQFEEFFLQRPMPRDKHIATQFVSDIASLYEETDSGIHIVFSMREEWFVKMDLFREYIPELFQNESSLRLRFFQPQQAEEAIVGPLELRGVEIERPLINEVISDLTNEDGEIEPAQLQIICDTLWQNKAEVGRITLNDYTTLGQKYAAGPKGQNQKISQQVLTGRLVEAFGNLKTEAELKLVSQLLPELSTDQNTKSFKDIDSLANGLDVTKEELQPLIKYLDDSGLIRILDRGDVTFVELAHDYLAHRTRLNDLRKRIEAIWPAKLLDEAISAEQTYQEARTAALPEEDLKALATQLESSKSLESLKTISDNVATAEYDSKQLEFLFRWALSRGVEQQVELWFRQASKSGVEVWQTLQDAIVGAGEFSEEAENAVRLLARLQGDDRIWDLFSAALKRQGLASVAVEVLGEIRVPQSVKLLASALSEPELARNIIAALSRIRTPEAVTALEKALTMPDLSQIAADALQRISSGREGDVALMARASFDSWIRRNEAGSDISKTRDAPDKPGSEKPTPRHPKETDGTLERDIPAAWFTNTRGGSSGEDRSISADDETNWGLTSRLERLEERDWQVMLSRISQQRCTPVLGAGLTFGSLPFGSDLARYWAKEYQYPLEDSSDLMNVAQFLQVRYDSWFAAEQIRKVLERNPVPDFSDPDEPHIILARLPFTVYLTTNYDDFLAQALRREGRSPVQKICQWNRFIKEYSESSDDAEPTFEQPLVFHLHGLANISESLVLSGDDHLTYLSNLSREDRVLPIRVQQALTSSSLLFMGYHFEERGFQILTHVLSQYLERSLVRNHFYQLIPPRGERPRNQVMAIEKYFAEYLDRRLGARAYWGTSRDFAMELKERWNQLEK